MKWSTNHYNVSVPSVKTINTVGPKETTVTVLADSNYNEIIEESFRTVMTVVLNDIRERTGCSDSSCFQETSKKVEI